MQRFLPFLRWFKKYNIHHLRSDLISGLTVALVLIPQSMAYAQLADLPAYYGLYAAFLPPIIAALFGSSNQLATGPVAIVSLMTSTALAPLATAGSESFIAYAIVLALLVGIFQFLLGVFRLGLVVNFLSHPVVNGFTNAAAIIIATSQLSKLFGVNAEKAEHHYQTVYYVLKAAVHSTHLPTLGIAILAFAIMYTLRRINRKIPDVLIAVVLTSLISWMFGYEHNTKIKLSSIADTEIHTEIGRYNLSISEITALMNDKIDLGRQLREAEDATGKHSFQVLDLSHRMSLLDLEIDQLKERASRLRSELQEYSFVESKSQAGAFFLEEHAPGSIERGQRKWHLKVGNRQLDVEQLTMVGGGAVVGSIPSGLPKISAPKVNISLIISLFPMAIVISLLGFMEAISIAKAMAVRTGQRLDPNQELIGQGLANIVGSFAQSYAVSGSFSRSAVNIQTGAVTGISNVISSGVVLLILLFFTPLLYYLPQASLAAIIMMAVIGLLNVRGFVHAWRAQKYDGVIAVITFVATLAFAPELDRGILIGVLLSLGHFLVRNIKPDLAILSKFTDGTYRNADRRNLHKCRHIAVVRYNNSLFFANVSYLEEKILDLVEKMPELRHIHIVGNGINELDASGEDMLSMLVSRLREGGYDVSFSGLNDEVIDVMIRTNLYDKIGEDHIFGNVALALWSFYDQAHKNSTEKECPLVEVYYKGFDVDPEMVKKMEDADARALKTQKKQQK